MAKKTPLTRFFPKVGISSEVRHVNADFRATVVRRSPSVLLSAVDNAQTRLLLQSLGRELNLPVVHGGTDLFVAECYTQERGGPCSMSRCTARCPLPLPENLRALVVAGVRPTPAMSSLACSQAL